MGYDESMILTHRFTAIAEEADKTTMVPHRCPICEKRHWVNQARHSVAWGRQFTCSCECEARRRLRMRRKDYEN